MSKASKRSWTDLAVGGGIAASVVGGAAYYNAQQSDEPPTAPQAQHATDDFKPNTPPVLKEKTATNDRLVAADNSPNNAYNILKKYDFTNQQGEAVNMDALRTAMKDDFAVVSFGFSRCPVVCPQINSNLAKLGREQKDLQFIVVSTDPYDNEPNAKNATSAQEQRDAFMSKLAQAGLDPSRVTLLYPENRQTQGKLQKEFGEVFEYRAPGHTSKVTLLAPGGRKLDERDGRKLQEVQQLSSIIERQERGR